MCNKPNAILEEDRLIACTQHHELDRTSVMDPTLDRTSVMDPTFCHPPPEC